VKLLTVTITLEMEVPDEWELQPTSEGMEVVKIGEDRFLDMTFEPLLASDPESTWTNSASEEFLNQLLDMVESEDVSYELSPIH
jgi:hypothetical protein